MTQGDKNMADETNPTQVAADREVQRLALFGEFLAIMAHEINNLMVGVLGYADLELSMEKNEESAANLQRICECGAAVRDLTRQLLHFARPGDSATSGSVEKAVEATLGLMARKLRDVDVTADIAPDLPAVRMSTADLRLILANLVKNAVDAMAECESREIRITARATSRHTLRVGLWNSGPLISEDEISHLFEPFFTTKGEGAGTGLGLSIARRLADAAGGKLSARNTGGRGVLFELEVPASAQQIAEAASNKNATVPRLEGHRILVVDDETSVREVTKLMVSKIGGGTVDTCASGEEALTRLAAESFDAIVLDVRMSGLTGEDVYRSLSEEQRRRVVFVTGDTMGSATEHFLESTHQPALFKPIGWKELIEAVHKVATA
jgi:CheY-like chemotaxis protein/anti-sigma regulatory factor (Ser/Thr protein kinase)